MRGLSILCGCPADVIKTLMQAGLIHSTEVAGRHTETGPNAILLSDVMLQNGAFCNLAEFPVLQMLYRAGHDPAGHPNNKGVRPLLIGNAQQVGGAAALYSSRQLRPGRRRRAGRGRGRR